MKSRKIWPRRHSGSFAAEFVQSMVFALHPGQHWADPEVQARRLAEIEKEQAQIAAYHQRAAKEEEDRINRQEREKFATSGKY